MHGTGVLAFWLSVLLCSGISNASIGRRPHIAQMRAFPLCLLIRSGRISVCQVTSAKTLDSLIRLERTSTSHEEPPLRHENMAHLRAHAQTIASVRHPCTPQLSGVLNWRLGVLRIPLRITSNSNRMVSTSLSLLPTLSLIFALPRSAFLVDPTGDVPHSSTLGSIHQCRFCFSSGYGGRGQSTGCM